MGEFPVVCENCGTTWPDDYFEREGTRLVLCSACKPDADGRSTE